MLLHSIFYYVYFILIHYFIWYDITLHQITSWHITQDTTLVDRWNNWHFITLHCCLFFNCSDIRQYDLADSSYLNSQSSNLYSHTPSSPSSLSLSHTHTHAHIASSWIEEEEDRISRYGQTRLAVDSRIKLLGRTGNWKSRHLPIFSFLIQRGSRFLHYNFVAALLNDLFGIQCRGKLHWTV